MKQFQLVQRSAKVLLWSTADAGSCCRPNSVPGIDFRRHLYATHPCLLLPTVSPVPQCCIEATTTADVQQLLCNMECCSAPMHGRQWDCTARQCSACTPPLLSRPSCEVSDMGMICTASRRPTPATTAIILTDSMHVGIIAYVCATGHCDGPS